MKRSGFTQERIIGVLKERQAGAAADPCRKHGVSDVTFHVWPFKHGGMEVSDSG